MSLKQIVGAALLGGALAGCEAPVAAPGLGAQAAGQAAAISDGIDRNVLIVNRSGQTVHRFYGSNVGTNSWEEDILGNAVLPAGRSVRVDFTDGTGFCDFDFRIQLEDGRVVEEYGIDVCEIGTFTIN